MPVSPLRHHEKQGGMAAANKGNMFFKSSSNFFQRVNLLGIILLLAGSLSTVWAAQSVTLAWSPSSDPSVVGYHVHYGTACGTYSTTIDVGNITTATISNLTAGTTYYFAVTAYNSLGVDSVDSNEASGTVAGSPTVILSTPGNSVNFNGPMAIALSAAASEMGGSIARVEFYSGTTKLGESTGSPYSFQWVAQPGCYALSAVAYDATGTAVQSMPVTVTVTQPAISAMQHMPDGTFQLTLTGAPGRNNSVYVSADLQNWTLLTTVMNTTGTLAVVDSQTGNSSRRYYRLVAD